VAPHAGKNAVTLDVQNRSSLTQNDVDAIRTTLARELANAGVRLSEARQPGTLVQVTLSENLQTYIWIAQLPSASSASVLMVTVPRSQPANVIDEPVTLVIRKIQLWAQPDQMLDVAVIDSSPPRLIILEPSRVVMYGLEGTSWREQSQFEVKQSRPWPRDLRGRLILRRDHLFDVHLPGVTCASGPAEQLSLSCRDSEDPWPVGGENANFTAFFSPARNFFTGVLGTGIGPDQIVPPFYTVANVTSGGRSTWIFPGVDGQVRMTTGNGMELLDPPDWGSDVAGLKSDCRSGDQILATGKNDPSSNDSGQAFELSGRKAVAVSPAVDFDGTVTALWTESSGRNVVGIVRSEKTGTYEAFRLALTCGH
jgi:hypothetical protein